MMVFRLVAGLLAALCAIGPVAAQAPDQRLNAMRVLGSHNSYRPELTEQALAEQRRILGVESPGVEYGHPPIARQLDLGLRQVEFDPVADPFGGLFAAPYVGDAASFAAMRRPGAKVLHVPFVDRHSLCLTLDACFAEVAAWSRAHPGHTPITVLVNASDGQGDNPIMPQLMPFDAKALAAIDASARAIFGSARLITPDQVRGHWPTLREAVLHGGWPGLTAARGKVLLVLDTNDRVLDVYRHGHAALRGRAMFGTYPEGDAEAAILNIQNPVAEEERIRRAVAQGFIVRTRADSDTVEARRGDYRRFQAALRSGAQIISTDYYPGAPDPLHLGFTVRLP
ncbi:MAG: Ca2+-dependent phosphoinositide-specific phospholipase C [Pseudomonadota bacterium]|jgi:hypothetical protein